MNRIPETGDRNLTIRERRGVNLLLIALLTTLGLWISYPASAGMGILLVAVLVLPRIRAILRPVSVSITDDEFIVEAEHRSFRCPVDHVRDVLLERKTLRIRLWEVGSVEPYEQRLPLTESMDFPSPNFAKLSSGFTRKQIDVIRLRLGKEKQAEAGAAVSPYLMCFHEAGQYGDCNVVPIVVLVKSAVFLLMAFKGVSVFAPDPVDLVDWGANYRPLTPGGEWWRLLTATCVPAGLLHFGVSMFVLCRAGWLAERLLGPGSVAVVYVTSAILGNLQSAISQPDQVHAGMSVGALGLVAAVLACVHIHSRTVPRPLREMFERSL